VSKPYPAEFFPDHEAAPAAESAAGQFEVALNLVEKKIVRHLMSGAGVEQNVRSTLRSLAGDGLTPVELERLEERVLDRATQKDIHALWGIEAGAPVMISPNQKAVIDSLVGRLGDDPLAQRAGASYRRVLKGGRVRVH